MATDAAVEYSDMTKDLGEKIVALTLKEAKEYIEKKDPTDLLGLVWRRRKGIHDKPYRVCTELEFGLELKLIAEE